MHTLRFSCQLFHAAGLDGVDKVRVPGERAFVCKREASAHGVPLSLPIVEGLKPYCEKLGLAMPSPM